MELFLLLLNILLLVFIIRYIKTVHSNFLLIKSYYYILSFKIITGILLGIVYLHYYHGGDTVNYGNDLEFLSATFYSDFEYYSELIFKGRMINASEPGLLYYNDIRAFAFVRVLSPLYILSGSNYWMLSIYVSLFSFFGLWILSDTLIKLYNVNPLSVLVSFFVFPSVVFWSSGVIKESISIGMMSIIISIILSLVNRQNNFTIFKLLLLLSFSYCLLNIKYYYFAIMFAIILPYGFVKYLSFFVKIINIKKGLRICMLAILIVLMFALASFFHPLLNINRIVDSLFLNYTISLNKSILNGTYFSFEGLVSTPISFVQHLPKAMLFGLFGPFIWQMTNFFSGLSGIENTILAILFILFLISNLKKKSYLRIDIEWISLVTYISILAIFMAFASPNWGSLVRYKIGYLPFFLIIILNENPVILYLERRFSFLNFPSK